jgi:hypothetical protein
MYGYILALLVALIAVGFYRWVLLPRKLMAQYSKNYKNRGFRILDFPFKLHTAPVFDRVFEDIKNHDDPYHSHKVEYCFKDVAISNMFAKPNIVLLNAELIKEATAADKVMVMVKEAKIYEVFFSIFKKGILSS